MFRHYLKLALAIFVALLIVGCAYGNHISRGDELYAAGDYEAALAQYDAALKIEPDSEEALNKIELTKRKLVESYRVEADQKIAAGDYLGAIMAASLAHQELPGGKGTRDVIQSVSAAATQQAERYFASGDYANATFLYDAIAQRLPPVASVAERRSVELKVEWAKKLAKEAQEAEAAGRPADAMLLYGKAAQLSGDASLGGNRDRLRRKLIDSWTYLVMLEGRRSDHGFAKSVASSLRGASLGTLLIVDREDMGGRLPQAVSTLSMSRPQYRYESTTRIATTQYQSGTRQVENPFYQNRVNDLEREERSLIDKENEVMRYENDVARYQQAVASEGPSPNTSTGAEQSLSRAMSSLEYARNRVGDQRNQVQRAREALRQEPQFKEEPVYATLEYPIKTTTVYGEAGVTGDIRHNDGRLRIDLGVVLTVSASDDEHGSYSVAGISTDPLTLPGERALDNAIFEKAVAHVGNGAAESFKAWRETIFQRGQRAATDDERVEWFMIYVLTNPEDVKTEASSTIASLRGVPDPATVAQGL